MSKNKPQRRLTVSRLDDAISHILGGRMKRVIMVSPCVLISVVCLSLPAYASDIAAYRAATVGKTSILLMLDTSGSMAISSLVLPNVNAYGSPGDVTTPLCTRSPVAEFLSNRISVTNINEWTYNLTDTSTGGKTAKLNTITIANADGTNPTVINYYTRGCTQGTGASAVTQYDRLSRLKDAIIPLLADRTSTGISDSVSMGVGNFSSRTNLTIEDSTLPLIDGHSGEILVPNAPLTTAQRVKIAQMIASFKSLDALTNEDGTSNPNLKISSSTTPYNTSYRKASSGTPTVQAYSEAAAYMMGTNTGTSATQNALTKISYIYDGYMLMQNNADNTKQVYFVCVALGASQTKSAINSSIYSDVRQCINNWPAYDSSNKTVTTGTITGGVYMPDSTVTGGWRKMTSQSDFMTRSGVTMSNAWDVFAQLPVGWRYGGWMKVPYEPLDIEPVVGTVYTGYSGPASGLVSYRTNPFTLIENQDGTYTPNTVGGMKFSDSTSISGSNYIAGGSTNSCDGNGIYFLTDGAPNSTTYGDGTAAHPNMAQTIMNQTLSNNSTYTFSAIPSGGLVSPTLQSGLFSGETGGWEYIGAYAKKLFDKTQNPANMSIKTATVGFGSSFAGIPKNADGSYNCAAAPNVDAQNLCLWGGSSYGNGGFYFAQNSADVKNSIINFVKNVTPPLPSVTTGTATIPTDALYSTQIQPYAYYAEFDPQPGKLDKLWLGNMKKYDVYNSVVGLKSGSSITPLVDSSGKLQRLTDLWAASDISGTLGSISLQGGMLSKIPVGNVASGSITQVASTRQIYSNRTVTPATGSTLASATANDTANTALTSYSMSNIGTASDPVNQDPNRLYVLNLLGYDLPATTNISTVTSSILQTTPRFTKVGAELHSKPILLTQGGKVTLDSSGTATTSGRDDYVLFGTTQGVLHVVTASGTNLGQEKFAFVPSEMLDSTNQQKDFLNAMSQDTTTNANIDYGIDGPWTSYTEYVPTSGGGLTVGSGKVSGLTGKQWVYGGLRMGGKSYYALDLGDMNNPKLKFHINPTGSCSNSNPLGCMGQSWSKPVIAKVNWNGKPKLVMFVGGGYDAGYESSTYNPTTAAGNGVYMFDANNGDLLWWASSSATTRGFNTGDTNNTQATQNSNLTYSVVSRIKVVDRNADGLVDELYFGDLGGQAFRVDIDNSSGAHTLVKRVVRILNLNNGAVSPRFYEAPAFTTQNNASGNVFGVVSFGSGNRSQPLYPLNSDGSFTAVPSGMTNDGVFAVFDKDVARTDLYTTSTLNTQDVTTGTGAGNLVITDRNTSGASDTNGGWYYLFANTNTTNSYTTSMKQVIKVIDEPVAIGNDLYVSAFDSSQAGASGSCGSGVKGESFANRFCLPYGVCGRDPSNDKFSLGIGMQGISIGAGSNNNSESRGLVFTSQSKKDAAQTNSSLYQYATPTKLIPQRWYEKYSDPTKVGN